MKVYLPIKRKFPHPWWHRFFMTILSCGESGNYENWYCPRCDKRFVLRARKAEDAVEITP